MKIFSKSNRKGNMVLDGLMIVIFIAVFAIGLLYGAKAIGDINTDLQADDDFSAEAKASLAKSTSDYNIAFNNAFLFFMILFWAGAIVSSIFIDSRPEFFIISILLLVIILWIGGEMSNAFFDVANDPEMVSTASQFTYMTWVFEHYIMIILAIVTSIGIALFAKSKSQGAF